MEGAEHPIAMQQELTAVAIRQPLEGQFVSGAECRKQRGLIDLSHCVRYHGKVPLGTDSRYAGLVAHCPKTRNAPASLGHHNDGWRWSSGPIRFSGAQRGLWYYQ